MAEEKQENKEEQDVGFFRFYKDGFDKTRPMFEKIIYALARSGYIPQEFLMPENTTPENIDPKATLDKIIKECEGIDKAEIEATGGLVKEGHIGLQGFFNKHKPQISQEKKEKLKAKALASLSSKGNIAAILTKCKYTSEEISAFQNLNPQQIVDRLFAGNPLESEKTLDFLGELGVKFESEAFKEMGSKAMEQMPRDPVDADNLSDQEKESHFEAKAFIGQLKVGPYFPRLTCTAASHFMGEGNVMQIGCSQGKTTVVAMTTYEQLKKGKKVFSTSSSPGLVPENYDEARAFYEEMGIAEDFCSISQNANDNVDHIVLFHNGQKFEVRAGGPGRAPDIWVETPAKDEKGKDIMVMKHMDFTPADIQGLGLVPIGKGESFDFEASVKKMMADKKIIMGDTITLGKYQHLMPDRNDDGVVPNSFLIVDEADAELLDAHPQEILGQAYEGTQAISRANYRRAAFETISNFSGNPNELESKAKELNIPYEFLLDAYQAKQDYSSPSKFTVRDGRVFVLNPNTNVMMPASQGLAQAILTANPSLGQIPEYEVLGETDIPKLFSNFEVASLMSGTMQDKGLNPQNMSESYIRARKNFLSLCGPGVDASIADGIIDWKLVTPMTREELGDVVVNGQGMTRDANGRISSISENFNGDWRSYIFDETGQKRPSIDENWRKAIAEEAKFRSDGGRPVMISVYGDRNPAGSIIDPVSGEPIKSYTDQNQIGGKHLIGDKKCLFVRDGKGEIATFDDFYGRGYTFAFSQMDSDGNAKLDEKGKPEKSKPGGHVLITSLPQNSRNLEQFLFRVARGGDKGSSSIIISPGDPVLIGYLQKLEAEQGKDTANAYFSKVLSGQIKVEDLVKDIYPKQTEKIFATKASLIIARNELETYEKRQIIELAKFAPALVEKFSKEFKKMMVSEMKHFRLSGVPNKETILKRADEIVYSLLPRDLAAEVLEASKQDMEYNQETVKESKDTTKEKMEQENPQRMTQTNPNKEEEYEK